MVAKITQDGLWRVSYGESADLTFEEVLARQPEKFRIMLRLEPDQYRVANCYPYRIHQRCAERFRVGRVCLAADAAHIVNPHGGLGLTGGIMDAGGLSQCLIGIAEGKATPDILDRYDEVRRRSKFPAFLRKPILVQTLFQACLSTNSGLLTAAVWHEIINPVSIDNMKRISSDPELVADTDPLIQMSRKAWYDEEVLKQQHAFAYAICHDFSQYFSKGPKEPSIKASETQASSNHIEVAVGDD